MTAPEPLKAVDFQTVYDAERTFPFYEDENATGVYGYGHPDAAEFASAVQEYDEYTSGEKFEDYTADIVHFGYAVRGETEEISWRHAREDEPGAFPPIVWIRR